MIEKIFATLGANIPMSLAFILAGWAVVITYHTSQWSWFIFFIMFLLFFIFRLALISTFYDAAKRKNRI